VNRILPIIISLGSCLLLIACSAPASQAPAGTATAVRQATLLETATPLVLAASATEPPVTAMPPATVALSQVVSITPETAPPTMTGTPSATATPPPPTETATPTRTPAPTRTPRPAATATPTTIITAIGEVAARADGEIVTVSGRVVTTASFSHGYKFQLEDGSGRITLLLWHNVYDDAWDAPRLNLGATVRATGKVGRFEGELQLEPAFGSQVRVTAAPAALPPQQEIGALGEHMGQRVTIVGHISRVQGGGQGTTLTVADESGDVAVFIWDNILARIAGNHALGEAGTRVRVTGFVSEFRSNRQIVPTLPYDVEVLP
jgi:DNA/RNA endonuclease YhcR with UshA esterase domain